MEIYRKCCWDVFLHDVFSMISGYFMGYPWVNHPQICQPWSWVSPLNNGDVVWEKNRDLSGINITHIYIYNPHIYIYIYICLYMYIYTCFCR